MTTMLTAGLPATVVTLFPSTACHGRELFSHGSLATVENLLALDFTPVLHGDVLLDSSQKCCIFSGDEIMLWFCKYAHISCKPKLAVFLTDVAGVYDKPPTEPGAKLIKEILVGENGSV